MQKWFVTSHLFYDPPPLSIIFGQKKNKKSCFFYLFFVKLLDFFKWDNEHISNVPCQACPCNSFHQLLRSLWNYRVKLKLIKSQPSKSSTREHFQLCTTYKVYKGNDFDVFFSLENKKINFKILKKHFRSLKVNLLSWKYGAMKIWTIIHS